MVFGGGGCLLDFLTGFLVDVLFGHGSCYSAGRRVAPTIEIIRAKMPFGLLEPNESYVCPKQERQGNTNIGQRGLEDFLKGYPMFFGPERIIIEANRSHRLSHLSSVSATGDEDFDAKAKNGRQAGKEL